MPLVEFFNIWASKFGLRFKLNFLNTPVYFFFPFLKLHFFSYYTRKMTFLHKKKRLVFLEAIDTSNEVICNLDLNVKTFQKLFI
jgi:hypothetical protein